MLCFMSTFFDNILLSLESELLFHLVLRVDVLLFQLKLLTQRREATQFYFHLTQLQPEKRANYNLNSIQGIPFLCNKNLLSY